MFIWRKTWERQLEKERELLSRLEKLVLERDKYKRELERIRDQVAKTLPEVIVYTTA